MTWGVCAQVQPGSFQLNIGHVKPVNGGSKHWERFDIAQETLEMVMDLCSDPQVAEEAGLVGLLQCEFDQETPLNPSVQQVNITAWSDEQAAHDWYVSNHAHKRIVEQHHRGGLQSFSSVLCRLEPSALRYQRRCFDCQTIDHDSSSVACRKCNGSLWDMPWF